MLSMLYIHGGSCATGIPCLDNIGRDTDNFIVPFKNLVNNEALLINGPELQKFVDSHDQDFYGLTVSGIIKHCTGSNNANMNLLADTDEITIPFMISSQKYELIVNTDKLFMHMQRPVAFLVMKDTNKRPGDIVNKSDIPKNTYFFSNACSDHTIRFNLSNKAAVNQAGQAAFAAYGGAENEFFLDMPVGKSCRAFPGLVLGDFGAINSQEKIVVYTNYKEARKALKAFVGALHNTACSNQGLAVYLVDIENIPPEKDNMSIWVAVGGILGTFVPPNLADIQRVTILSEPEIIK